MRQRRRTHRQQNHRTLLRHRQNTQRRRTHQRTTTQSIRIQRLRHQLHLTRTQRPQRRRTRTTTSRQLRRPINLTIQRKRRRLRQNLTNTAEPPQIRQPQTRQLIRRRALIIPLQNLRQAIQSEAGQLRIITDQQLTKRRIPRLRVARRNLIRRQQLQRITQRITQRRRTQQAAHPVRKLSRNLRCTCELNRRKTHRAIIPRVVRMRGGCARRLRAHARGVGVYQAALCSRLREEDVPGGFVLMLAGECPLFSAWGRFEDGAPAPHEHLRRGGVPAPRMGRYLGRSPRSTRVPTPRWGLSRGFRP